MRKSILSYLSLLLLPLSVSALQSSQSQVKIQALQKQQCLVPKNLPSILLDQIYYATGDFIFRFLIIDEQGHEFFGPEYHSTEIPTLPLNLVSISPSMIGHCSLYYQIVSAKSPGCLFSRIQSDSNLCSMNFIPICIANAMSIGGEDGGKTFVGNISLMPG